MAKYQKDFPEKLYQAMKNGYSFQASMATLGAHRDTGYDWCKKYPKFKEAKKRGEDAGLKFLESIALSDLTGTIPESMQKKGSKRINTTMAIFLLKTRFHAVYGERLRLENDDDKNKDNDNLVKIAFDPTVLAKKGKK